MARWAALPALLLLLLGGFEGAGAAAPPRQDSAIGDSVMLGAASELRAAIPAISVDAVVSRQWTAGVSTVDQMRAGGRLGPKLVVGLGTNGTVSAAQFDAMERAAAGAQRLVVVSVRVPRPWQDEVNATLRDGVARHPGTVLADWYGASAAHPEWFASDGYHLQPGGARAYAALISQALRTGGGAAGGSRPSPRSRGSVHA